MYFYLSIIPSTISSSATPLQKAVTPRSKVSMSLQGNRLFQAGLITNTQNGRPTVSADERFLDRLVVFHIQAQTRKCCLR